MNKVYEKSKIYMKKKWNSNKDDRRKYSEYRNVVSVWSAKKAPEISRRKAKVIKKMPINWYIQLIYILSVVCLVVSEFEIHAGKWTIIRISLLTWPWLNILWQNKKWKKNIEQRNIVEWNQKSRLVSPTYEKFKKLCSLDKILGR